MCSEIVHLRFTEYCLLSAMSSNYLIYMDSNILLILIIDGGLILFFLYALYYISKLSTSTVENKPIKIQDKEKPTAIKAKDYEPTYTPSPISPQPAEEITVEEAPDQPIEVVELQPADTIDERLQGISIIDVEGIGPAYETRLNNIGITTVGELLTEGATPGGRKIIAEDTGITEKLVLEWVNICDLYRIYGVGEEYSDLLEEAGVDTVPELARRNPENLHTKLSEVNNEKNLVRRLPTLSNVEQWVREAKKLPRRIEY